MSNAAHHTFETPEQLYAWLRVNRASESELWVRIFKKASGHWPALRHLGRLRGGSYLLRLDRRAAQRLGRHLVSAMPDSISPGSGRAQRWALGQRLRRQRHHGDALRLFGGAATRPRCPRFLRHAQTSEPVHHLPPAAQRQAAGNPAEAHGGVVGEVGAGRRPLFLLVRS